MRITDEDVKILLAIGVPTEDIPQIKEAAKAKYTRYKLTETGERITGAKAVELLGRRVYLSGLVRSAFHYTSERVGPTGVHVSFDSSALFR